MKKTFENLYL